MRAFYLIVIVDAAAEEKEYDVTNYSFLGLDMRLRILQSIARVKYWKVKKLKIQERNTLDSEEDFRRWETNWLT